MCSYMYGAIQVIYFTKRLFLFFEISRQKGGWFELKDETRSYTTRIYLVLVMLQFSTTELIFNLSFYFLNCVSSSYCCSRRNAFLVRVEKQI